MAEKQKIMIVDDDTNISNLVSLYLKKECFDTICVDDGEKAVKEFESYKPDLVVLDIMLPGIDGYEVCREIRKTSQVPIIMLSAKGEIFDKVLGLELGADDYMEKPFDSKELVARIKSILRRFRNANEMAMKKAQNAPGTQAPSGAEASYGAAAGHVEAGKSAGGSDFVTGFGAGGSFDIGGGTQAVTPSIGGTFGVPTTDPSNMKQEMVSYPDLVINLSNYSVNYCGKHIDMPPKELELLYFLAAHPNRVFTREQLLDHIWGYEYIGDTRTVDVHIKRLREKIHDHGDWALATVWGIGYKFSYNEK